MTTRKTQRLAIMGAIASLVIFFGNSGGPLDGLTGAPGDFGTCDFCHPDNSPTQTGNVEIFGFPSVITPLTTYPIEIRLNKTSGIARTGGFELVVLDGNMPSSSSAGSWSSSDPFVTISTSSDRTYVKHGPAEYEYDEMSPDPETIVYDAEWTAPANVDAIWVYIAANIGGFPAGSAGDLILVDSLSNIPLPIELISFAASRDRNGDPLLEWSTSSETNTDRYDIMRSSNGRNFDIIDNVNAAGFSTTTRYYSYLDNDPIPNGVTFYKLRIVDIDGMVHYSGIESLNSDVDSEIQFTVFPNPLKIGQCIFVDVQTPRPLTDFEVSVWNHAGERVLGTTSADAEKGPGMNMVALDPGRLTEGMYYVRISASGEETVVRKLVVIE